LTFEHDPEKWVPVFRKKIMLKQKETERDDKVIALKGARYSGDRWSRARAFVSSGAVRSNARCRGQAFVRRAWLTMAFPTRNNPIQLG
jgi:hypothetical protein